MAEKRKIKRGVMRTILRKSVLEVLTEQLNLGTKTKKGTVSKKVPLTDKDKVRIQKEIETLKLRV